MSGELLVVVRRDYRIVQRTSSWRRVIITVVVVVMSCGKTCSENARPRENASKRHETETVTDRTKTTLQWISPGSRTNSTHTGIETL